MRVKVTVEVTNLISSYSKKWEQRAGAEELRQSSLRSFGWVPELLAPVSVFIRRAAAWTPFSYNDFLNLGSAENLLQGAFM